MRYLPLLLIFICTACLYKMPDKDCIATSPNTNNPGLTREKAQSPLPMMR